MKINSLSLSNVLNESFKSETKNSDYSYVTDPSVRFYAGMTLKEAQRNRVDESLWRRDFFNLDKNEDGVLSVEEIFKERKRESNINKAGAAVFGALSLLDIFTNSSQKIKMLNLSLDAIIILYCLYNVYSINKGNKEFKQRIASDNAKNLSINA